MAAISITAANVKPFGSDAKTKMEVAGETITAGQEVYRDSSDDSKVKLLNVDSAGTVASATSYGVAMAGASTDEPIEILTGGTYVTGGTMVAGEFYFGHPTAGAITSTFGDLSTGDRSTLVCYAITTTTAIRLHKSTGVEVA